MRVGLFFGSFDPPHIGHVNVVMGAINSSQVGRVLVIPAYQNLWKESSSKFSYRYAMSCMQFDTLPFVHVSDVEKDLAGPAYPRGIPTYVVLEELKSRMPEDANRVINILNRNDMWNDKLNSLIMESMKNHDAVRTTVLRAIKTEFSNYATAKNAKPLDNAAEVAIIKKLRDQRIDNAEQYRMVGRQDLYDNEMAESLILNEFLPEVPDDKVLALGLVEVCALQGCEDGPKIPKSKMGIIIKELKAMFPAADGKQIADLVKSCVV